MQKRLPAVYMRGGTSKAVFFHDNHLPRDPAIRDQVILAAFGSPDPKGTIVDEVLGHGALEKKFVRLGHPGGVIEVGTELIRKGDVIIYGKAILGRTARRLM